MADSGLVEKRKKGRRGLWNGQTCEVVESRIDDGGLVEKRGKRCRGVWKGQTREVV